MIQTTVLDILQTTAIGTTQIIDLETIQVAIQKTKIITTDLAKFK